MNGRPGVIVQVSSAKQFVQTNNKKNDDILQMGRRLKKVSTTLHKRHKRRPDALSRTPAKGFQTGIC